MWLFHASPIEWYGSMEQPQQFGYHRYRCLDAQTSNRMRSYISKNCDQSVVRRLPLSATDTIIRTRRTGCSDSCRFSDYYTLLCNVHTLLCTRSMRAQLLATKTCWLIFAHILCLSFVYKFWKLSKPLQPWRVRVIPWVCRDFSSYSTFFDFVSFWCIYTFSSVPLTNWGAVKKLTMTECKEWADLKQNF